MNTKTNNNVWSGRYLTNPFVYNKSNYKYYSLDYAIGPDRYPIHVPDVPVPLNIK